MLSLAAVAPAALAAPDGTLRRGRFLMGTTCTVTAYPGPGEEATAAAVERALDAVARAEDLLSTWRADTELARLNRQAGRRAVAVSAELRAFLTEALELARRTGGAFDPAVGTLIDAWDLRGGGRLPEPGHLAAAQRSSGFRHVRMAPDGSVRFEVDGLWLDAGGLGKGYALDRAADALRAAGVDAALLDFGGQLLALGAPPGQEAWTVAVADPRRRERTALVLRLRDASVATSAQSQRGRLVEGRWLGHILDPRTGEPSPHQGSASVIARSAVEADALATALLVLGPAGVERAGGAAAYLEPVAGDGLELHANPGFRRHLAAVREGIRQPGRRAGVRP